MAAMKVGKCIFGKVVVVGSGGRGNSIKSSGC